MLRFIEVVIKWLLLLPETFILSRVRAAERWQVVRFRAGARTPAISVCLDVMTPLFFFYIILIFCVIDLPADTYGVLHGVAVVFCVVRWRWFVSETFFFFLLVLFLLSLQSEVSALTF